MGNCFSEDVSSGPGATASVSGTASSSSALATTNDAVDYYLKSRGYNGLFSQIEVPFFITLSPFFLLSEGLCFCLIIIFFLAVIFFCYKFARP